MGGKDRRGVLKKAEQETGLAEMVLTVIADMFQSSIPYREIPWQGASHEGVVIRRSPRVLAVEAMTHCLKLE
jgi:hypothetical protein